MLVLSTSLSWFHSTGRVCLAWIRRMSGKAFTQFFLHSWTWWTQDLRRVRAFSSLTVKVTHISNFQEESVYSECISFLYSFYMSYWVHFVFHELSFCLIHGCPQFGYQLLYLLVSTFPVFRVILRYDIIRILSPRFVGKKTFLSCHNRLTRVASNLSDSVCSQSRHRSDVRYPLP